MTKQNDKLRQEPRIEAYLNILKQDHTLYQTSRRCIAELDKPEEQMYAVCLAPTLVCYVTWVLKEALKDGQKRLYFLARDAYPMYLVAKALVSDMDLPIEIRYLRVSRYALRIPEYHLLGEACLDRLFLSGIDVSLYQILKRSGMNTSEIHRISKDLQCDSILEKNLNPREIQDLKHYVLKCCRENKTDLLETIYANSHAAYKNAIGYLQQEGLMDPIPYAVVDSGWVGTIQQSLRNILKESQPEIQITGYYFGLYALPKVRNGCHYKSYYFQPYGSIRRKVRFSNCLYEVMYSEPCPMVKEYAWNNQKYQPVFSTIDNPNKDNLRKNHHILKRYMEIFVSIARTADLVQVKAHAIPEKQILSDGNRIRMVEQLYSQVMATPNAWEADWYGRQLFSDDLADDHMRGIANDLSQKEIRNLRIINKLLIMLGLSRKELHESGWIEGSIVNAKKHIASNLRAARRAKCLTYLRQSVKARKQRIR